MRLNNYMRQCDCILNVCYRIELSVWWTDVDVFFLFESWCSPYGPISIWFNSWSGLFFVILIPKIKLIIKVICKSRYRQQCETILILSWSLFTLLFYYCSEPRLDLRDNKIPPLLRLLEYYFSIQYLWSHLRINHNRNRF